MGVYKILYLNNEVTVIESATNMIFPGRFIAEHQRNRLMYAYVNANNETEARKEEVVIAELYKG